MRKLTILSLLMALAAVLGSSPVIAQTVGNCALGSATKDLDANNVQARLYNNGGLFWRGSGNVYTIPKTGNANSVFASGIWIGGIDANGELRFAGTAYGPWEFWPGPLDDNGNPPADCSQFDNVWKVTQDDLARYTETGEATSDMQTWPWQLGAPVADGDGDPNNYNLAGGDFPEVTGEQTAWWIMNDVGGSKDWSGTPPIGLEVQVTAFAFRTSDALNNTTFYKYKLIQKGSTPLNDVYFGIWSDPDLGNAADDYVGSDSTLGLGYVYNGESIDAGLDGYGNTPPALAYDFFQGPLVPAPGEEHTDPDGTVFPDSRRLNMTRFVYYNNDSTPQGNPSGTTQEPYNYLRGIWRDGQPITFGGTGYGGTEETNFMFPGDPVSAEFWSEENTNGAGARNTPADRRFLMSTGPFDLTPGDEQEIVYGIVWARSTNRLASVAQMRFDDILAQGAFNSDFNIPAPPDAPNLTAEAADSGVILEWGYTPSSNNFLNAYDEESAFLVDTNPADGNTTYTFEGYRVFQYESEIQADNAGTTIATFDVPNNVTTVVDDAIDLATGGVITQVVANGSDSGVQNYLEVGNLTNGTEYHFGIQAYAFNNNSSPQIYASPIERISVIPTAPTSRDGGTIVQSATSDQLLSTRTAGTGDSFGVFATVANPLAVTGDSYEVRIYGATLGDAEVQTYDIVNSTTGTKLIDGAAYIAANDRNVPFGNDILVEDGLSFSVSGAPPDFTDFKVIANASGPLADAAGASSDWQGFPGIGRASRGGPQQTNGSTWHFHTADNGSRASFEAFVSRTTRDNFGNRDIVPFDFEMRFTEEGSLAYDPYCTGSTFRVPFELWNTGIATPDDPSDDFRMAPYVLDQDLNDAYNLQTTDLLAANACFGGAAADHTGSSLNNDPQTDWVYWTYPDDQSPGDAGYRAWETAAEALGGGDDGSFFNVLTTPLSMDRTVLFNWNGGDVDGGVYDADFPETGTIFRIETTKPLANGDVFSIASADSAPLTQQADAAQEALESIRMVPNPYKAVSSYETDLRSDKVRFINLPAEANISIYTLDGTLIRSLQKSSAGTTLDWDLTNQESLPIASGMYIIHIDAPGVGEKIIKFGAIIGRTQLDLF